MRVRRKEFVDWGIALQRLADSLEAGFAQFQELELQDNAGPAKRPLGIEIGRSVVGLRAGGSPGGTFVAGPSGRAE
jgi:hypothetical protein